MKVSNFLAATGATVGSTAGAAGMFLMPLCQVSQKSTDECMTMVMISTLMLTAGGATAGALTGKVTGIIIERTWNFFVQE